MVVFAPLIIAEPREERRFALFEDCGASGGTGSAVSEERGFAGVGESSHAARDPVEAGQDEDGALSCWESANPNDETERQLPVPQRAAGKRAFLGAIQKTGISVCPLASVVPRLAVTCLATVRRVSGQPCSPSQTVGFGVLATARQPLGLARVAVLPNPPRLRGFRSAAAPIRGAGGTSGRVRRFVRLLGLAPVRRLSSPGGFVRDPRRCSALPGYRLP